MSKTAVITARIDVETLAILDRLAEAQGRSRAWLVAQAVKQFAENEAEFLTFVQAGVDAAEKGDVLSQGQMEDWFAARTRNVAAE